MRKTRVFFALVLMLVFSLNAHSKDLKMATIFAENSVWGESIKAYAEKVSNLSGGELTVTPYWGSQLGNQKETLNKMLRGRLDIWSGPASSFGVFLPESNVVGLPFVFKNESHLVCVIDKIGNKLKTRASERGQIINYFPVGWVALAAKEEYSSVDDIQNVKVRTGVQDVATSFWRMVGAQAVPITAGDMNQALATNLVRAAEQVIPFYAAVATYSVAPYYINTNHYYNVGAWIVSPRTWATLTKEQQSILVEAQKSVPFSKQVADLVDVQDSLKKDLTEKGVKFIDPTQEELAEWRDIGATSREKIVESFSDDAKAFYPVILEAAKNCSE